MFFHGSRIYVRAKNTLFCPGFAKYISAPIKYGASPTCCMSPGTVGNNMDNTITSGVVYRCMAIDSPTVRHPQYYLRSFYRQHARNFRIITVFAYHYSHDSKIGMKDRMIVARKKNVYLFCNGIIS